MFRISKFTVRAENKYGDWLLTVGFIVLLLLAASILQERILRLPYKEETYQNSPTLWTLQELSLKRALAFITILVFCIVLQVRERVKLSDLGRLAQGLLIAAVMTQTYTLGFLDYNHFFDNWMLLDRLLLWGLGIFVIFRPLFLPFFILQLILMTAQHKFPQIIGFDNVHKSIAIPILLYFWLWAVLSRFIKVKDGKQLAVLPAMAILSLWYIFAGIGKLQIDWQSQNSLYHLFAAATDAGWLSGWSQEVKVWMGEALTQYRDFLLWSTIILEIALPLLLFFNRTTALIASISLMVFHLFVYLFSGILFWQWTVLELVYMFFLIFRPDDVRSLFTWKNRSAYWLLLLLIPISVHVGKLSWFDCGYINLYTFYLVDKEGNRTQLDATYFSPYDTGFAKNRFYFTTRFKTIANTYGQCNDAELLKLVEQWSEATTEDNLGIIEEFRRRKGSARYDEDKARRFRDFLVTFISNKNRYDPKLISNFSVPPHMQQGPDQRNLQVADLDHLAVIFEEKAILPGLQYEPIKRDSFFISLAQ